MDPPLLRQASFDMMVSLPVDDTVVTILSPFVAESYPCPYSLMYEGFPSISPSLVVPDTLFSPLEYSGTALVDFDIVVPETQLTPGNDSILAKMEFEYALGPSIEVHPMSIETKAGLYVSTLKMMAIFLPKFIGKDDVDSPYYPTPAEIKDFLRSSTSQGWFDIISLNGSFIVNESGGTKSRAGGMSVALVAPDGRIIAGGLAGLLVAASPVQVIVGTFLHGGQQDKEQEPTVKKTRTPGLAAVPTSLFSGHTNITFGSGFEMSYNNEQNNLNFSPTNATHGSNSKEVNPTHYGVSC